MFKKIKHNFGLQDSVGSFQNGFTLIELLVSMAIFLIIITIVVGVFMIGMGGTARLFGRQNALDSARYILESMGKEIRMSTINTTDGINLSQLDLKNSKGCHVIYNFDNSAKNLSRDVRSDSDPSCTEAISVPPPPLNPNGVEMTGSFYILGSSIQPRVTIVLNAKNIASVAQQVEINLQTTISSREYK